MNEPLTPLLEQAIERFHADSLEHKRLYRSGQTTIIATTAMTTVAAGAGIVTPELWKPWLQFLVLLLSASTTAATAWLELRKARDLWQHEREVYYALVDLQREIRFESALKEPTEADQRRYFARLAEVLQASTLKWRGLLAKKDG